VTSEGPTRDRGAMPCRSSRSCPQTEGDTMTTLYRRAHSSCSWCRRSAYTDAAVPLSSVCQPCMGSRPHRDCDYGRDHAHVGDPSAGGGYRDSILVPPMATAIVAVLMACRTRLCQWQPRHPDQGRPPQPKRRAAVGCSRRRDWRCGYIRRHIFNWHYGGIAG
jgi:hypothetical protein